MKETKVFYGYFVAAACFLLALIALGLSNGTCGLYVKPICDDMGFSRGGYSFVLTLSSIVSMIASLTFGTIHKWVGGVKIIFIIGVVSLIGAFSIYSFATNLYLFCSGAILMGVGTTYVAFAPMSVVISNWFIKKRGSVLGIVFAGSGIGSAIFNPIVSRWIETSGWRFAYISSIILILIFCVPALFVLRGKPSNMGLLPFGREKDNNLFSIDSDLSGVTLWKARKTQAFWFTAVAVFCFGFSIQPVYLNSPAHMGEAGLEAKTIAVVICVLFIFNTISKMILGIINDKYGIKSLIIINNLFFIIAVVILIFANSNVFGFIFAVTFGIGYTMLSITTPLLVVKVFGQKEYEKIVGIIMAIQTAGSSIGIFLSGLFFDIFHTYNFGFLFEIIMDFTGVVLILAACDKKERPNRDKVGELLKSEIR